MNLSSFPHLFERKQLGLMLSTLVGLLLLTSTVSTAQSISKLDSIKSLYNETTNDSLKITLEIELSRALHKNQHNEDQEYAYA